MEAIDVANFPDDFGGQKKPPHQNHFKTLAPFFFLLEYEGCVFGDAPYPISQGFLGERVFELCAVAGVVYSVK